jgi:signal transduction histidine kinase
VSFHRRLTLYGTAIAALTTLILWVLLIVLTSLGAQGDQRTALETASVEAVETWRAEGRLDPVPSTDLDEPSDILVSTVGGDGRLDQPITVGGEPIVIPQDSLLTALAEGHAFETVIVRSVPIRLSIRPLPDLSGSDYVAALQSRLVAESAAEEIMPALVIASIVILIAAYRASSVVARRAITPLEQISEYSTRITDTGDTSRQLEVGRRGREIDDVVASFNAMVTQLARSRDRTAAALESQRRFVADASHELRTPLTTIRANATFLREHPDASDHDRGEAVADIVSESERMSILTARLLDLARADADVLELNLEDVDLGAVCERVARQASSPDRAVRSKGVATLRADRELITRLVWILVDNALVHGEGTVTIEADETEAAVIVTVSDEGPGIPATERHAVFDRFHRVDGTRRQGSGLGLSLAKEIVEAHGGSISIEDSDGAVVLVTLPVV